jgi:hypothetical protein
MYDEPVMAVGILKSMPSKYVSPSASTLSLGKTHWTWDFIKKPMALLSFNCLKLSRISEQSLIGDKLFSLMKTKRSF